MVAVMGRPPEHALLRAHLRPEGEDELEGARGLERAVRGVAVVADGGAGHPEVIEPDREGHELPGDPDEEGPDQRDEMARDERDRAVEIELLVPASREGAGIGHWQGSN